MNLDTQDPYGAPYGDQPPPQETPTGGGGNWWDGPPPAGWTGQWPPPLGPGQSYGPTPGSINYGPGSNTTVNPDSPNPFLQPTKTSGGDPTPPPPRPTTNTPGGPGDPSFRLDTPFPGGTWKPPTPTPLPTAPTPGPAPTFGKPDVGTAPALPTTAPFSYKEFQAPSVDDALNDPGYKFRLDQGNNALQNWAAARGTLNDSGTAKALLDYGQGAGSQEYENVWNRDFGAYKTGFTNALDAYTTNYKTQTYDPYEASFNAWSRGTVDPTLAGFGANVNSALAGYNANNNFSLTKYQNEAQNTQHNNDIANTNAWNTWLQNWNIWKDQRDSTFDKKFKVATA